jgi:tetratricopeptide (TPR) repeat protein
MAQADTAFEYQIVKYASVEPIIAKLDLSEMSNILQTCDMRYSLVRSISVQLLFAAALPALSWPEQISRGSSQFDHGLYLQALTEYDAALPLAASPQQRAITLYRMAVTHARLAEFVPAEKYHKEALALFRASHAFQQAAVSLTALGEIYRAEGRLDDALATERGALSAMKRLDMLRTQAAATVFSLIGEILSDRHHFRAAEGYLRSALSVIEKTQNPDQADYATCLNNLGVIAAERRRPADAEKMLVRALHIRESRFGPEHPLVANTLLSLSSVYLDEKRFADAGRTCRRSLDMMQRFLPPSHPDVIKATIGLALIARRGGDPTGAVGILARAVQGLDAAPSPAASVDSVRLLNLYALYLGEAGDREGSRQIRLRARQVVRQSAWMSQGHATVSLGELEARGLR